MEIIMAKNSCHLVIFYVIIIASIQQNFLKIGVDGEIFTLGYLTGSKRRTGDFEYIKPGLFTLPFQFNEKKNISPTAHHHIFDFFVCNSWEIFFLSLELQQIKYEISYHLCNHIRFLLCLLCGYENKTKILYWLLGNSANEQWQTGFQFFVFNSS